MHDFIRVSAGVFVYLVLCACLGEEENREGRGKWKEKRDKAMERM